MVKELLRNHQLGKATGGRDLFGPQNTRDGYWTNQSPNLKSFIPGGETLNFLYRHGSHRERRRFGAWGVRGALSVSLLGIHSKLKACWTSMANRSTTICHPNWFAFSWTIIYFSTLQWPQSHLQAVSGLFAQGEWRSAATADGHAAIVTWPKPTGVGLQWDKLQSKGKKSNKCSPSLGTPAKLSKNHFRWPPHESHWENAETVPSSKQRKAVLKN